MEQGKAALCTLGSCEITNREKMFGRFRAHMSRGQFIQKSPGLRDLLMFRPFLEMTGDSGKTVLCTSASAFLASFIPLDWGHELGCL